MSGMNADDFCCLRCDQCCKAAKALLADAGLATANLTDTTLLHCTRAPNNALATSDVVTKMSAAYVDVWQDQRVRY